MKTHKHIQKGFILQSGDQKLEVLARLEDLVWTREIFTREDGGIAYSPVSCAQELNDLLTFGFKQL